MKAALYAMDTKDRAGVSTFSEQQRQILTSGAYKGKEEPRVAKQLFIRFRNDSVELVLLNDSHLG